MPDWSDIAGYGVPGFVVALVAFLLAKLIERGFTFQVPPKRRG